MANGKRKALVEGADRSKVSELGQEGRRHGAYYVLTWSDGGRTRSHHVPREKLAKVKRMTRNYQLARKALRKLGEFNRRLVLEEE